MIKYYCDRCEAEIPADKIISIMKLWRSSKYTMSGATTEPIGKMSKVEGVEKDEKTLCQKCADEVWKCADKKDK